MSSGGAEADPEEPPDDDMAIGGRSLRAMISIEGCLFALLSALVFCLYTLRLGYSEWFALCAGGLASLMLGRTGSPAKRTLAAWVAWLAYGTAAAYCGFYSARFDAWLSVLPVGCMLASHLHPQRREAIAIALSACVCLPASSAVAPELPFAELAAKSALFALAFSRDREDGAEARCAWILYSPLLSPVFGIGAALHAALAFRERKKADEVPELPELPPIKAAPPPPPPKKTNKKQSV